MSTIVKKGKFVGNPEKSEFLTTYKAEEAIGFGRAVKIGTNDDQSSFVGSTGTDMLGIAVEANEKIGTDDVRDYDQYDTMKIGQKGTFYVEVQEAVNKGDPVGVISSSNGSGTGIDQTTGDFGPASTYTEIDAQFAESGSIGDEVKIQLNLPM